MAVATSAAAAAEPPLQRFEFSRVEMAVPIKIVLYAPDETTAEQAATAAFDRIHVLNGILSDYDPNSELRRLCDTAARGKAVPVSRDLWKVFHRAQEVSKQSGGAFDVTIGPLSRLWRRAIRRSVFPSDERLDEARPLVDYRLVRLDEKNRSVELLTPGMRLDLGGIAKGYAVDEALAVLNKAGITRALVDAGGDICLGDPPPGKSGWRIGVAPLQADGPPSTLLSLADVAVATSGDAWQYVEIDGTRYSHIIDPRSGMALTDHSSVTVIAPNCITADALASTVSVLGPQQGLKLIDATPGTAALIVRAPQGKVETHKSKRWEGGVKNDE
ncbi:MAG: FAD:protein FMN transferase [Candidatus Nealsonbacteria bacterium]|nr:FAD:protein FMN transferase [Candidatus Nealsonbacteria bacterium]